VQGARSPVERREILFHFSCDVVSFSEDSAVPNAVAIG
jgi:hypothetical protein